MVRQALGVLRPITGNAQPGPRRAAFGRGLWHYWPKNFPSATEPSANQRIVLDVRGAHELAVASSDFFLLIIRFVEDEEHCSCCERRRYR